MDAGTTIHVIDDDPAVRDSLKLLLELGGHRVATYGSGESFLRDRPVRASPTRQCILLDLDMPGMNGLQLLDRLRAEGTAPPVIIITGRGKGFDEIEAVGAAALLEKPFAESALLACIESVLAQSAVVQSTLTQSTLA